MKKKIWRKYLPILNIYLQIPFIDIRTSILRESAESLTIELFVIEWRIYKWNGAFKLYKREFENL